MELAKLGHPILGPQSYWKLTPGEIRIYAEGMQEQADRQRDAGKYGADGPSHDTRARKQREEEALQRVHERAAQQDA